MEGLLEQTIPFGICIIALTTFYLILRSKFQDNVSQRSWILTLASSVVTSISGTYHLYMVVAHGWEPYIFTHSPFSQVTLVYFIAYLCLDLLIGVIDYRSKITFLAGWVHHTCYMMMLTYLLLRGQSIPFCLFLFEEIPTATFSVGFLYKRWRHDNLFGGTYLVTRLLLHMYLMKHIYELDVIGWPFAFAVLPLHFYWFSEWIMQQRRLRSK